MNEKQVRDLLFKEFLNWMRGQTCGIDKDGNTDYYDCDVNAFLKKIRTGYDRQEDPLAWD